MGQQFSGKPLAAAALTGKTMSISSVAWGGSSMILCAKTCSRRPRYKKRRGKLQDVFPWCTYRFVEEAHVWVLILSGRAIEKTIAKGTVVYASIAASEVR